MKTSPRGKKKNSPSSKGPLDMHDYKSIENHDKIKKYAFKEMNGANSDLHNTMNNTMFTTTKRLDAVLDLNNELVSQT